MPLTDEELQAQLANLGQTNAPVLPMSTQEVGNMAAMASQSGSRNAPGDLGLRHQQFLRQIGAEEGVPFHEEGLPTWDDIMVKARENTEDQIRYLVRKFGAENVRLNAQQEPVVRIKKKGSDKFEDYPVNPHQWTMDSMTGLAAYAPEIVATGLALKLGKAGAKSGMLYRALVGAMGTEAGKVGKELGAEVVSGEKPQVIDALERGIGNLPVDFAGNMALESGWKGLQVGGRLLSGKRLPNPIAKTKLMQPADPTLTKEGVQAAQELQTASGINPNLTSAEVTGIPIVAQTEKYVESQAAGASTIIKQKLRREQAAKDLQNWMVDPATLGTDEEVGRQGLAVLSKPVTALKNKIQQLKEQIGIAGSLDEIALQKARADEVSRQQLDLIGKLGGKLPLNGVPKSELGDALQQRALAARHASEQNYRQLYDIFDAHPLSKAKAIFEGGTLKQSVDDALKNLPSVEKAVQQPTGMVNQFGRPIMRTGTQEVPIETPIRPRLEEFSGKLKDGRVSLNDLKQMRTDVGNAIKYGEAVMQTKDRRLNSLYAELSRAIEGSLQQFNDPALTKAFKDASAAFEAHANKFTEKTVAPFFKEAEQAGSLGQAAFTDKLLHNPDAYSAAVKFFGAASPEVARILDTARMDVLERSLSTDASIDGKKLVNALSALRKDNPKVFNDALGNNGQALLKQADILGTFQERLPMEELAKLLASRNPASKIALISLQRAEKDLATKYQNQVVKRFLSGEGERSALEPDQFVRFLPKAKLSDVKEVMDILDKESPDVAVQIRRKTIQSLLNDAKRNPTPRDAMAMWKGEPGDIVSSAGLAEALGTGDQRLKYQRILRSLPGDPRPSFENLVRYGKMETLAAEKERVGAGAGMLAKGQGVNQLEKALTFSGPKGSILKELSTLARIKVFSIILAHPKLSDFLLRPDSLADMPKTLQTLITSEPFIRGAIEEFGNPGEAYKVIATLRTGLRQSKPQLDDETLKAKLDKIQSQRQ